MRRDRPRPERPLQPVATATVIASGLLAGLVVAALLSVALGSGAIFGWGDADACAPLRRNVVWSFDRTELPVAANADATPPGGVQLCVHQPTFGQHLLASVQQGSVALVYLIAVFGLLGLVRTAERRGPFHPRTARAARRLGWWLLLGMPVAVVLQAIGATRLYATVAVAPVRPMDWVYEIHPPYAAVLTGAAVLTVARLLRVGSGMREEIEATV